MRILISWISQYMFCPYAFYIEHVLGIKPKVSRAMIVGAERHKQLEREFAEMGYEYVDIEEALERAPAEGMEFRYREFWINASYLNSELVGKIDELWIRPDGIYIIEDKPLKSRNGGIYQVKGYAYAFKKVYSPSLPIHMVVRNRDTLEEMWNDIYSDYFESEITGIIQEIYEILRGKKIPEPTDDPKRCVGCRFRDYCNKRR